MLRRDLERAGIPYADAQGRVMDFHSLGVTFVTNLSRAGVSLTTAQKLARHSDPKLTANTYTRLDIDDLAGAVESLLALRNNSSVATDGSSGAPVVPSQGTTCPPLAILSTPGDLVLSLIRFRTVALSPWLSRQ